MTAKIYRRKYKPSLEMISGDGLTKYLIKGSSDKYQVVVEFNTEQEAEQFEILAREWAEMRQRVDDFIPPF